nr:hypothetical protein [uncultured Desulfobulbus sp.]
MSESNTQVGQRIQEKFRFYTLSLIFTLLGLAVQTAKFGTSMHADLIELGSWGFLLISAFTLMSHIEWSPQLYRLFDLQSDLKSDQQNLKKALSSGSPVIDKYQHPINPDNYLQILEKRLSIIDNQIGKIDTGSQWKHKIHKASFLLGLMFLITSRAYSPITSIIKRIIE